MSTDQNNNESSKKILYFSQTTAVILTVIWLIVCCVALSLYHPKNPSLGDIGALLSGIFAPIAWLWFLASYTVQTKELSLQRRELTLQRKALETQIEELQHSVAAQQGSEIALTEQSKVLAKQLEATERQFQIYLEDRENSKPKYTLGENYDVQFLYSPERGEEPLYFQCRFSLINIGAEADIKLIEVLHILKNKTIDTNPSAKHWIEAAIYAKTEIEVTSDLPIEDSHRLETGEFSLSNCAPTSSDILFSPEKRLARQMCREYLLQCQFVIYYSSSLGSGSDTYYFAQTDNGWLLTKEYQ